MSLVTSVSSGSASVAGDQPTRSPPQGALNRMALNRMALSEADGMQGGKYPTAGRYPRNT